MIGWFKKKIEAREKALLEKDRQVKAYHAEIESLMQERERVLFFQRESIDNYSRMVSEQADRLSKIKQSIEDYSAHLEEREKLLNKIKKDIEADKESMLGKDNLEIKRSILLPAMQKKWEAEAASIDADRANILLNTPKIYISLASKKLECENQIKIIKGKPSSMGNQTLLVQWEARLHQLTEIIEMIDKEKSSNEKDNLHCLIP